MDYDDDDIVRTPDVASVFKTFITEKLRNVSISTQQKIINFQSWDWSTGFPRACLCEVVYLEDNAWMSSLYPTTTKIIMHGALYDGETLLFNPSIYFVGTDNKRSEVYIRQPTSEKLRAALQYFVSCAPPAASSPLHSRPLDNGSMMQRVHQILEVCERIDKKTT